MSLSFTDKPLERLQRKNARRCLQGLCSLAESLLKGDTHIYKKARPHCNLNFPVAGTEMVPKFALICESYNKFDKILYLVIPRCCLSLLDPKERSLPKMFLTITLPFNIIWLQSRCAVASKSYGILLVGIMTWMSEHTIVYLLSVSTVHESKNLCTCSTLSDGSLSSSNVCSNSMC